MPHSVATWDIMTKEATKEPHPRLPTRPPRMGRMASVKPQEMHGVSVLAGGQNIPESSCLT